MSFTQIKGTVVYSFYYFAQYLRLICMYLLLRLWFMCVESPAVLKLVPEMNAKTILANNGKVLSPASFSCAVCNVS